MQIKGGPGFQPVVAAPAFPYRVGALPTISLPGGTGFQPVHHRPEAGAPSIIGVAGLNARVRGKIGWVWDQNLKIMAVVSPQTIAF